MKNVNREVKTAAKITVITLIIVILILSTSLLINYIAGSSSRNTPATISCNIIYEKDDVNPAWIDIKFSDRLSKAIESDEINLYGINLIRQYDCKKEGELIYSPSFEETKDAVAGTASKLKISHVRYVKYSEEYIHKYFSEGYEPSEEGYYEYTIDLV